jgi:hypothetical protein
MKSRLTTIHRFAGCATAVFFTLSLVGSALAQGPRESRPNINLRAEDQKRQLQEGRLRTAEWDALGESENEKLVQAALVKMKEDFARIQVLRNDIARNLVSHKPLDYNLISAQTGEIHKHASRLNIYILAHFADTDGTHESAELKREEMVSALVKLCKLVDSFTENPALKHAGSVDVKEIEKVKDEKARADKDLLAIITLSQAIKKRSDNLKAQQ